MRRVLAGCLATAALAVVGCGDDRTASAPSESLPQGSEPVKLDPADFTTTIDNPYWPMRPGSRWVYREEEGGAVNRVVVTVTPRTKTIAGIQARVVHDVVSEGGKLVEDTFDWYAQDRRGNLWYMGEATKEYENGRFKTSKGSWQTGVDGAQAGIVLPAHPRAGQTYRQEYYAGEAEDRGGILSLDEQVEVAAGHWAGVLETKDTTPLEPRVLEHKYYARGVGPALTIGLSGTVGREELVSFSRG